MAIFVCQCLENRLGLQIWTFASMQCISFKNDCNLLQKAKYVNNMSHHYLINSMLSTVGKSLTNNIHWQMYVCCISSELHILLAGYEKVLKFTLPCLHAIVLITVIEIHNLKCFCIGQLVYISK